MTDEQVWNDLARFAQAMKLGATVVMNNGARYCGDETAGNVDFGVMARLKGIREIIEPPQKKVRPLNAEEWLDVAGCVVINASRIFVCMVPGRRNEQEANYYASARMTCHPPGNSKDVRKLWVEK